MRVMEPLLLVSGLKTIKAGRTRLRQVIWYTAYNVHSSHGGHYYVYLQCRLFIFSLRLSDVPLYIRVICTSLLSFLIVIFHTPLFFLVISQYYLLLYFFGPFTTLHCCNAGKDTGDQLGEYLTSTCKLYCRLLYK